MPLTLSIRNIPDAVAKRLRERARENHRSLQGEILSILESSALPRRIGLAEAGMRLRGLGLKTPDESARWIREDRDSS